MLQTAWSGITGRCRLPHRYDRDPRSHDETGQTIGVRDGVRSRRERMTHGEADARCRRRRIASPLSPDAATSADWRDTTAETLVL